MIVITSAAYIEPDLRVEFGFLPPSFLPLGNARLFTYQLSAIRRNLGSQQIVLSLPESFEIPTNDYVKLNEEGVSIVKVPDEFALGESLLYVVNSIGEYDNVCRVLHGDTLIADIPIDSDIIGTAVNRDEYDWETEESGKEQLIWCGYFAFSDSRLLTKCLTRMRGNFVRSVHEYSSKRPLTRCSISEWSDFGHANTYFRSRSVVRTTRAFNSLDVAGPLALKSSTNQSAIEAEVFWFKEVPTPLQIHCPKLLRHWSEESRSYYELEYIHAVPLNEVYVYGRNRPYFWKHIFSHFRRFFLKAQKSYHEFNQTQDDTIEKDMRELIRDKTFRRLAQFSKQTQTCLDTKMEINGDVVPSLNEISEICVGNVSVENIIPGIIHGDFCLSNVFYDSRADLIKVVDPRGMNEAGELSIFGDQRYDLAKMAHSVWGLYDFIIADQYSLNVASDYRYQLDIFIHERVQYIQDVFSEEFSGDSAVVFDSEVYAVMVLLFLSMLPLHNDCETRQSALLANGLRLFREVLM